MYYHLRPPDVMPLPTKIFLGNRGHQRLNFDGSIYIHYVAPPYFRDTVIIASVYGG